MLKLPQSSRLGVLGKAVSAGGKDVDSVIADVREARLLDVEVRDTLAVGVQLVDRNPGGIGGVSGSVGGRYGSLEGEAFHQGNLAVGGKVAHILSQTEGQLYLAWIIFLLGGLEYGGGPLWCQLQFMAQRPCGKKRIQHQKCNTDSDDDMKIFLDLHFFMV